MSKEFFTDLRQQSDQKFKSNRIRRMITGHKEILDTNPRNYIPTLPEDIREKFTQDDTTHSVLFNQSNRSVISNKSTINRSNKKLLDENNENRSPLQSSKTANKSNSRYKLKSFLNESEDELQKDKTVSIRTTLVDNTNQAEKSRRDQTCLEKTDLLSDRNVVLQKDDSRLKLHNTKLGKKSKQLNSTAISSDPRSNKTLIPITPILASKTSLNRIADHKSIISSDEELDENEYKRVDKSKSAIKSVNNSKKFNATNNKTKLELPSRKSLNFANSGRPSHLSEKAPSYNDSDTDVTITNSPVANNTRQNKTRTINQTPNKSQNKTKDKTANKTNNTQNIYDNFEEEEMNNKTKTINNISKKLSKSSTTKASICIEPIEEDLNQYDEETNVEEISRTNGKELNQSKPKIIEAKSIRSDMSNRQVNKSKSIIEPSSSQESNSQRKENELLEPNFQEPGLEIEEEIIPSPKIKQSKITIQRLDKKQKEAIKPIATENTSKSKEKTPTLEQETKSNDSITHMINEFQGTLAKKAVNKHLENLKTPNNENTSLNASETELIKTNNNIYIKKSFTKSVNTTASTTINTTSKQASYAKKTTAELVTPFLNNPKQTKLGFIAPPPPPVPVPRPKSPINLNKSNKNTTANEHMIQMGFSNIEPVDMFSPSNSMDNLDNAEEKEEENRVKEKKKVEEKKQLIIIKTKENEKENKKSRKATSSSSSSSSSQNKISKPLETISNNISPTQAKRKHTRRKMKPTQEREKNFRFRRQTILPVATEDHEEEEQAGLRRSKRVKIDSSTVPVYQWETITDFSGKKLLVETIVGTSKRPCMLNDYYNEMHEKNDKKSLLKKSKKQIVRPKRDLSDESDSDNDSDSISQKKTSKTTKNSNKPTKKPRNSLETSFNESSIEITNYTNTDNNNYINQNDTTTTKSQQILVRKNLNMTDLTEASLVLDANESHINESQESVLFQDGDSSNKVKKHVITYFHNLKSIEFQECYEGVSLKAFSENNGFICIESNSWTRTQTHHNECEYTLSSGSCLVSLNGQVSRLSSHDIIHIPAEVSYKIKNISPNDKAYLYFRFFQS